MKIILQVPEAVFTSPMGDVIGAALALKKAALKLANFTEQKIYIQFEDGTPAAVVLPEGK